MNIQLFSNNASSRLAQAIGASTTAITVQAGHGDKFPAPPSGDFFLVTLDDRRTGQIEICKCTKRTGDTLTVIRGREGTAGQSFEMGASVSNRLTAETIQAYVANNFSPVEADQLYVNIIGDTMTGSLITKHLAGVDPTQPREAVNKDYVDRKTAVAGSASIDRAGMVDMIANDGFVPLNKIVYMLSGHTYLGKTGATVIPDLPGLIPLGDVHVEHFGAKGDMTWEQRFLGMNTLGTCDSGPFKLTGTDDYAAFRLADDYAISSRAGVFYAERDYWLGQQFRLRSKLRSRTGFKNYLWTTYDTLENGIVISSSDAAITGFNLIPQYDITTPPTRPPNAGYIGNALGVMNEDYLFSTEEHPLITGVEIDVRFCRCGQDRLGNSPSTQISDSGGYFFFGGNVEQCNFRVGLWGKHNARTHAFVGSHWGMKYHGGDRFTDFLNMNIDIVYGACDNTLDITTPIDEIDSPHGLGVGIGLSTNGTIKVSDIQSRGLGAVLGISCDVLRPMINERQRYKIMHGIEVGFINSVDTPYGDYDFPDKGLDGIAVNIASAGVLPLNTTKHPGTDRWLNTQIDCSIKIKGMSISRGSWGPMYAGYRAVVLSSIWGSVDLGKISTYGFGRGLDVTYCDGSQVLDYVEGDGVIRYTYSRGGQILGTTTDRGAIPGNPADGFYGPGYAADNGAVLVAGNISKTKTTADAIAGQTKTFIIPLGQPVVYGDPGLDSTPNVYIGSPIKIGPYTVTATDYIPGYVVAQLGPQEGVPYLLHTPLPGPVPTDSEVIVDRTCRVGFLGLSSSSGEVALTVNSSVIEHLDMSRLGYAGRVGVKLSNSRVNINSNIPPVVGVDTTGDITEKYTIWGNTGSLVTVTGAGIPKNIAVNKTFGMIADSYGGGNVLLNKCRVEDVNSLMIPLSDLPLATPPYPPVDAATIPPRMLRQLTMVGCFGFDNLVVFHPYRAGTNANGMFVYHENGTVECWIRHVITDATGKYVWVFPATMNGGEGVVSVTATLSSSLHPWVVTAGPPTGVITNPTPPPATLNIPMQVTFQVLDPATGLPITAATSFHAHAIGRWI